VGTALTAGVAAVAAVGAFRQSRQTAGRVRLSWRITAVAVALWAAALGCFTRDAVAGQIIGQPRTGDVLAILAACGGSVALLIGPTTPATWALRLRALIDGAAVAGSLFLLLWAPLLRQAYELLAGTVGPAIVIVPSIDIINLAIVIILVARSDTARGWTGLHALAGGYAILAAMALVYLYLVVLQGQSWYTTATLGGCLTGSLLLAIATRVGLPAGREVAEQPTTVRTALPYLPIVSAFVTAAVLQTHRNLDAVQVWAVLLISALVLVRQFLTVHTNTRLLREVQHQRRHLAHQATHDPLTGLANRTLLGDRMAQQAPASPIGILMIDLDDFKSINDRLGHAAGDRYLVTAADRMRQCVRSGDTVARLGGDEFVVLLAEVAEPSLAHDVAHRVLAAFAAPFELGGTVVSIGASIGVAVGDGSTEALLQTADAALYEAKAHGKNRFVRRDDAGSLSKPRSARRWTF
jgi:diguanylate cyclase (GGDEF)-like protein